MAYKRKCGKELALSLIDLEAFARANGVRVTHYRLTEEQFDYLCAHKGQAVRKYRKFNGYPIKVYPDACT